MKQRYIWIMGKIQRYSLSGSKRMTGSWGFRTGMLGILLFCFFAGQAQIKMPGMVIPNDSWGVIDVNKLYGGCMQVNNRTELMDVDVQYLKKGMLFVVYDDDDVSPGLQTKLYMFLPPEGLWDYETPFKIPAADQNKTIATASLDTYLQEVTFSDGSGATLPIATDAVLGGIRVGIGLTIDPLTGVLSASGAGGALEDLSNVSITVKATNDILQWDGSAWVNKTLTDAIPAASSSEAGLLSPADKDKLDVISGTNTGDQTLTFNDATKKLAISGTGGNEVDLSGIAGTGTISGVTGETYLSVSGENIQAGAVDLSGSHATGILNAGRFPALTGDVTTTAGSLATNLKTVGTAGTYRSVTTDAQGRVTAGTNPTTLEDYGITGTTAGDVLQWDGTNWLNTSLNGLGLTNADVGLGNVKNVDQTNADNLTSGTIDAARYGDGTIPVSAIDATGTAGGSTVLYGDGSWGTLPLATTGQTGVIKVGAGLSVDAAGELSTSTALSELTDVSIAGAAMNDLLQWNGTDWVNKTLNAAIPAATTSADGLMSAADKTALDSKIAAVSHDASLTGNGTAANVLGLNTNAVGTSHMKGLGSAALAQGVSGNVLQSNGDGTFSWFDISSGVAADPSSLSLATGQFYIGNASSKASAIAKNAIPLSGFGAAMASVDMGTQKITNLAVPTVDADAATKKYVDDKVGSLASIPTDRVLGNVSGSDGAPIALTGAQIKPLLGLSKDDVGLGNVENTALSTWPGSTSLTTLGTITAGTWNGSAIPVAYGGTGATTTTDALNALLPTQMGNPGKVLAVNSGADGVEWVDASNGTVTSVSVLPGNGITGSVSTASTTPAITLDLGNITPASVAATGTVTGTNLSGTNTGDETAEGIRTKLGIASLSGSNTGDQTLTFDGGTKELVISGTGSSVDLSSLGGGGVSSVTAGTGLSGDASTGDITLGLASIANKTLLGNNSGALAAPTALDAAAVKSVLDLSLVENTALSGWIGSSSLTTLGTIASGTWNGSAIPVAYGGTGATDAAAAINALLPDKTGNTGKVLAVTTDETGVEWKEAGSATLPIASTSVLGGIKIGANLNINESTGVLSATSIAHNHSIDGLSNVLISPKGTDDLLQWDATSAKWVNRTVSSAIPAVTLLDPGLMTAADKLKLDGIAEGANNYILPKASTTELGGVMVGTGLTISNGILKTTGGTGTVKEVTVIGNDGISGSVVNSTTMPEITLSLGDITPASVSTGTISATNISASGTIAGDIDMSNLTGAPLSPTQGGTGLTSLEALKSALNLENVTNTSDADKPVSNATQAALDMKLDKVEKGAPSGVVPLNASGVIDEIYLPASVAGDVSFKGAYDATNDIPALPDPALSSGDYYITSVAGTSYTLELNVGDWVLSDGVNWKKITRGSDVSSFNGRFGAVVPETNDYNTDMVQQGTTNLYYTDGKVDARINSTWKSINVTGNTDIKFPTEKAVKTYVDAKVPDFTSAEADKVLTVNGSGVATWTDPAGTSVTLTGAVTGSGTSTLNTTLANNIVTSEKITNGTIQGADIANSTIGALNLSGISTTSGTQGMALTSDGAGGFVFQGGSETDLSYSPAVASGTVVSSSGDDATIPGATGSSAGLMMASDKTKLDKIADLTGSADANKVLTSNADGTAATWQTPAAEGGGGAPHFYYANAGFDVGEFDVLVKGWGDHISCEWSVEPYGERDQCLMITVPTGAIIDYMRINVVSTSALLRIKNEVWGILKIVLKYDSPEFNKSLITIMPPSNLAVIGINGAYPNSPGDNSPHIYSTALGNTQVVHAEDNMLGLSMAGWQNMPSGTQIGEGFSVIMNF